MEHKRRISIRISAFCSKKKLCKTKRLFLNRHSRRLIPVIPVCPVCPVYPVPLRLDLLLTFRRCSLRLLPLLLSAAGGLHYELDKDLRLSTGSLLAPSRLLLSRILRRFLPGCFHQSLHLIGGNLEFFEFTFRDVIKRSFKASHNRHDLKVFFSASNTPAPLRPRPGGKNSGMP